MCIKYNSTFAEYEWNSNLLIDLMNNYNHEDSLKDVIYGYAFKTAYKMISQNAENEVRTKELMILILLDYKFPREFINEIIDDLYEQRKNDIEKQE